MAPYILYNKDITINYKLPKQKGAKGVEFNVVETIKFLIDKFPELNNMSDSQEIELKKFVRVKQSKYKTLFAKLKKSEQLFLQDSHVKAFLDTEIKVI